MLPIVLNHGQHCVFMAKCSGMQGSTLKKLLVRLRRGASEHLYQVRVQQRKESWKMFKCIGDKKLFHISSYAPHAADFTSQKDCGLLKRSVIKMFL